MWQLIVGCIGVCIGVVVLIWTFWQVISLLVWLHDRAPRNTITGKWASFTNSDASLKSSLSALRDAHNKLYDRHKACVREFTDKLQAICPHVDTTIEETEDVVRSTFRMGATLYSPAYDIRFGPYGRRTVEVCDVCGKELEDKFEEYVDQTPPDPVAGDLPHLHKLRKGDCY